MDRSADRPAVEGDREERAEAPASQPPEPSVPPHVEELVGALLRHPGFASGERRFPRRVERDEGADLAEQLMAQVDRACAARSQVSARQGLPIVCSRGCSGCCEELVLVYLPEAAAVTRYLMRPENHAARDAFLAGFPAWQKAVGDAAVRMSECVARGDNKGYVERHQAQWRRRILCAFNRDGECTVYPVRPLACRNAHAVETPTRCSGANVSGPPAARVEYQPLDEYLRGARTVLIAAHHAMGGERRRPQALCEAVHRLLQSALAAERRKA
ncbi:MAG: hypothetical protein U1A78_21470 [Polyangia bacterium]